HPRRHSLNNGGVFQISHPRLIDSPRAINRRQSRHLLLSKTANVCTAPATSAAHLWKVPLLPATRTFKGSAEELFISLNHTSERLNRVFDQSRQEAVPPAVQRGDTDGNFM